LKLLKYVDLDLHKLNLRKDIVWKFYDGEVINFSDDLWDFYKIAPLYRKSSLSFNFSKWPEPIKKEGKWLVYLILNKHHILNQNHLKITTVEVYFRAAITNLLDYCKNLNYSPIKLLETPRLLSAFVLKQNNYQLEHFNVLLNSLVRIPNIVSNIQFTDYKLVDEISNLASKAKIRKQHPVIPSRIYLNLINSLWSFLTDVENNKTNFSRFVERVSQDKKFARYHYTKNKSNIFHNDAALYELLPFFKKYNINSTKKLAIFMKKIQHSCKYLIHIYTGMRDSEVLTLEQDCLKIIKRETGDVYVIEGTTYKLNKTPIKVKWISSSKVEQAIKVSIYISELIRKTSGKCLNNKYIFISTGYLPFNSNMPKNDNLIIRLSKESCPLQLIRGDFTITETDLNELESIDSFQDSKCSYEINVGSQWVFTSHQFRRSLAVYAAQSGVVSFTSIKRQLKHITQDMTLYYTKGSSFAKDILKITEQKNNHIMFQIQNELPIAKASEYLKSIINCNEQLWGNYGKWLSNDKNLTLSKEEITKLVKSGQIEFKETPLGGCTSNTQCDRRLMRSVVECLKCTSAVIKPSKLNFAIEITESYVSKLPEDSIDKRLEENDLSVLRQYKYTMESKYDDDY